jgi:SAM-dependent methyltransferase
MTRWTRFDPAAWSAFLAGDCRGVLFRRGIQVAWGLLDDARRPGDVWLDAGCGPGDLARRLAASGSRVVALDADRAAVTFARGGDGQLAAVVGDAERMPVASAALDGVVATSLAGCLGSPEGFLREVGRVLRPGGSAVITFTNRSSVLLAVNGLADRLFGGPPPEVSPGAIRAFSLAEVRRSLAEAGLVPATARFYNFALFIGRWSFPRARMALRIERVTGRRRGRWLARNFAVVARKPSANGR